MKCKSVFVTLYSSALLPSSERCYGFAFCGSSRAEETQKSHKQQKNSRTDDPSGTTFVSGYSVAASNRRRLRLFSVGNDSNHRFKVVRVRLNHLQRLPNKTVLLPMRSIEDGLLIGDRPSGI